MSKIGNCRVSFYLNEIVTLRNNDWDYLKNFFYIPDNTEDIDTTPIILKTKVNIKTPLNNLLTLNSNGNPCNHNMQTTLFEPTTA
jgi:hypothetical protein